MVSVKMPAHGKALALPLAAVVLLCSTIFTALPSSAAEIGTVVNRLAIQEMLTQYSYRWDGKDAAGFSQLFTEDGVMERWVNKELVAGSRVEGREAIYNYALESHQGRLADRQTRHHFSGLVFIELGPDTAITENMALITHQTAADPAPVIRSSGIYRNNWRLTEEGWRISKRELHSDRFVPN